MERSYVRSRETIDATQVGARVEFDLMRYKELSIGDVWFIAPHGRSGPIRPASASPISCSEGRADSSAMRRSIHEPIPDNCADVPTVRTEHLVSLDSADDSAGTAVDLVAGDLERPAVLRVQVHSSPLDQIRTARYLMGVTCVQRHERPQSTRSTENCCAVQSGAATAELGTLFRNRIRG